MKVNFVYSTVCLKLACDLNSELPIKLEMDGLI